MKRTTEILLVSMPFAPLEQSHVTETALLGAARTRGIRAEALYASLRLGEKIGTAFYRFLSEDWWSRDTLVGEWLFSRPAELSTEEEHGVYGMRIQEEYRRLARERIGDSNLLSSVDFGELRTVCMQLVRDEAEKIVRFQPRIVCCGSSFCRRAASVAVLQIIKSLDPSIATMIAGAEGEDQMDAADLRRYPWVDYVFPEHAEETFLAICGLVLNDGTGSIRPGVPLGVTQCTNRRCALGEGYAFCKYFSHKDRFGAMSEAGISTFTGSRHPA
ncbi:MAG: hypothetical protein GF344_15285 [Chitinivibrionales bacterium]|nr:hypothetical protein [Chitinivibrionales bacterium]MBD3358068.1 hypothetical protein [Chitinivibrionales bacterium]